jgi:flavin reductase ActVB
VANARPLPQPVDGAGQDDVSAAFRDAMGRLAAGIVMVTTYVDGRPWGLTVSACCSVTVSPPMLLVSLGTTTTSARTIDASGRFGVSILGDHLIDTARFGSARNQPKFVERFCDGQRALASPVIAGAISHVDCRVEQAIVASDHTLFLGSVEHVVPGPGPSDASPLVYHSRRYHSLSLASDLGAAPGPNIWW